MDDRTAPILEQIAREQYREGVSAGAAARQICLVLGASGEYPTFTRMLEDMLADANRASADRSRILQAFADAAPEEAHEAKMDSFRRANGLDEHAPTEH